jgi:3-methylfumaryl-CoA hydratase
MSLDISYLKTWINRSESSHDVATVAPLKALSATLDRDDIIDLGSEISPCWHWLYFLLVPKQSEIGADGHAKRGGFLPPVPLPRRMWAGSRIEFHAPIRAGQAITRNSKILDVRLKEGRTGPLVFVHVEHQIRAEGQLAITEQHDIVYLNIPALGEPTPEGVLAPTDATWAREIHPDDVLLFRYSALTFNGHRIHYDRRYATQMEGYPGLIVHGPLIATLLLDLLRRSMPNAQVKTFTFKSVKPIFDIAPFKVCARKEGDTTVKLWAVTPEGHIAMDASATLA